MGMVGRGLMNLWGATNCWSPCGLARKNGGGNRRGGTRGKQERVMKDGGRKDSGRVSRAQHQQGRHRRMREDAATKKEKEKAMMHEELEAAVAAALQAAIAAALDAAVAAWRSRQHRVPGKVQSRAPAVGRWSERLRAAHKVPFVWFTYL